MRILILLLVFWVSGCAGVPEKKVSPGEIPPPEERYCLLFVVDGLGGEVAHRMIRNGELPNFKKHIHDRGIWVKEATSVFPSVTAAAMTSLMTGTYPARHDVVNFQWINRENGHYKSYIGTDIFDFIKDTNPEIKTIFEYFPRNETASFGFLLDKGSGHADSLIFTALNPFRGVAPQAHIALTELTSLLFLGNGNGFPRLMSVYEWHVDVKSHRKGITGNETKEELKEADAKFGSLVELYQQRGIYDQTYFILISDHGMAPVKKSFYLDEFFREQGFKPRRISWNLGESHIPQDWDRVDSLLGTTKRIYGRDVIIGAAGGGCATIDLVRNGGVSINGKKEKELWKERLTYSDARRYRKRDGKEADVIDMLINLKAVDFVLVRDDDDGVDGQRKARVINRKGETLITRTEIPGEGKFYKYEVLEGKDPLDLADEHQVRPYVKSGQFYEEKLWYEILEGEDYPDAVVQLCQIFDSPRAPTMLVSAAKYWSFNSRIIGKHAGLLEEEMIATFTFSGPGIPKKDIKQARIVDMVPTVLTLMGQEYDPDKLDGKPVWTLNRPEER